MIAQMIPPQFYLTSLCLIFTRIAIFLFTSPLTLLRQVPSLVKLILAITLAMYINLFIDNQNSPYPFMCIILKEIMVGFMLQIPFIIMLGVFQFALRIIDTLVGLNGLFFINPFANTEETPLEKLLYHFSLLILLIHLPETVFFEWFYRTFHYFPLHTFTLPKMSMTMFTQIIAPIAITLLPLVLFITVIECCQILLMKIYAFYQYQSVFLIIKIMGSIYLCKCLLLSIS